MATNALLEWSHQKISYLAEWIDLLLQTVSFFSAKNYLGERKRQIYQNYLFSLLLLSSPSLFLFRPSLV